MERIETRKVVKPLIKLGIVFLISFVFSNSDYMSSLACTKQKKTGISGTIGSSCCGGKPLQIKLTKEHLKQIEEKLNKSYSELNNIGFNFQWKALKYSEIPNLILMRSHNNFYYTDLQGQYIIEAKAWEVGKWLEVVEYETRPYVQINYDALLKQKNLWNALPHHWSIKLGIGKKKIALLSEMTCPYCLKVLYELFAIKKHSLKDLEISVFLMPTTKDDLKVITHFLNSPNPANPFMDMYKNPEDRTYVFDETVSKESVHIEPYYKHLFNLMQTHKFQGVPVIIRPDGEYRIGADKLHTLQNWIEEGNK